MQILGVSSQAIEDEEFWRQFADRVADESAARGFTSEEVDAMLGASLPAIVLKAAPAAAIAWAIFSAPATIEDNFPLWKSYFDKAISYASEIFDRWSIDGDSAKVIALAEVAANTRRRNTLELAFATQQSGGAAPIWTDILEGHARVIDGKSSDGNLAAALQDGCRYIFGMIVDGYRGFTVIVEADGGCSYVRELKPGDQHG